MLIGVSCLLSVGGSHLGHNRIRSRRLRPHPVRGSSGSTRRFLGLFGRPNRYTIWITAAVVEEESELEEAIHPRRGTRVDAVVAGCGLVVVVVASDAMEQGASSLGAHFHGPDIVLGALILAAVTSLPNAVSAIYLARRGSGAAAPSTALNSNSLNVAFGLLLARRADRSGEPSASGISLPVGMWD